MRRYLAIILTCLLVYGSPIGSYAEGNQEHFQLGDDLLLSNYHDLIDGKNIGLVTNQTGVNSQGKSMIDNLSGYPNTTLKALFAPEHGLDGNAKAGDYVESYRDAKLNIPVYSLYGDTRMPTEEMMSGIDVILFDIQDIGARSYTYISTLNYCMIAAEKYKKQVVVLDRPNPLGGQLVDGPVLEDPYKSFVGIDNLPMAHGMTIGELAQFFNRKIGADLKVVPMKGYSRNMMFSDTGLAWVQTSPYIPTIEAAIDYMATGLGEGTGIVQSEYFKWIGGKGIDSKKYADLLNQANLAGVQFTPEDREEGGGVKLTILDSRTFNPVRTGIYALAIAHQLNHFEVPVSQDGKITMFDKIMGTGKIGEMFIQDLSPADIENSYQASVAQFKNDRQPYLLYGNETGSVAQTQDLGKTTGIKKATIDGGIFRKEKSYVPFKSVFSQLGYKVSWDTMNHLIKASKGIWTVVIDPNATPMNVTVNGQLMGSEIDPFLRDGITYVPAFFVTYLEHSSTVERGEAIRIITEEQQIDVNYQTEKEPPKKVDTNGKIVYLTFDDGPSSITSELLDVLKENGVKATFFLVGRNINGREDIVQREVEEGHAIGNHTYSHDYNSIYRNENAFFADLDRGAKEIEEITGKTPTIMRFPGGSNNTVSKRAQETSGWIMKDLVQDVSDRGYHYFDWNVSTGDAETNSYSAESAIENVKKGVGDASKKEVIILAHDASPKRNTVRALPDIIQFLKDAGYSFETLDETTPTIAFLK
ncbi:MAG TPA: exo-beta-N-acetylmuramidase NamZ domain-containing protein [Bacillota bacterium]|nr:exo-beta-N-acetylmuramidase NamZ domain-containing protein [Bacillota bacterium]